jgi:pilus assembly protein Flp/PilA
MTRLDALTKTAAGALLRLRDDESGATAIEYAMIASGVAVAVAATVSVLGASVKNMFTTLAGMFP